jgi:predicted CoA-binding protein
MGSKSMEKHREKQEIFELLEGFLNPRSVAVVGATPDVKKGGYALVANLLGSKS